MEWMFLPLRRYAQFRGRARRKEFWMWALFLVLASLVLSLLDQALGLGGAVSPTPAGQPGYGFHTRGGLLTNLFSLATFLPNLAVQVRRLHDRDRSGWWILAPLLPLAAGVVLLLAAAIGGPGLAVAGGLLMAVGLVLALLLLVWFCLDGTPGPNRFGDDPKRIGGKLGDVFA